VVPPHPGLWRGPTAWCAVGQLRGCDPPELVDGRRLQHHEQAQRTATRPGRGPGPTATSRPPGSRSRRTPVHRQRRFRIRHRRRSRPSRRGRGCLRHAFDVLTRTPSQITTRSARGSGDAYPARLLTETPAGRPRSPDRPECEPGRHAAPPRPGLTSALSWSRNGRFTPPTKTPAHTAARLLRRN
jgi:hypothetical protein